MTNPNFKLATVVVAAALIAALIILAFACVLPQRAITKTYKSIEQELKKSFDAVYADDFDAASLYCGHVRDLIGRMIGPLEIYFEHSIVFELYTASQSAAAIAEMQDPAQLLEELSELATAVDFLYRIHKFNIYNIM